jgi:splicing factor 3B subunit 5
MKRSGPAAFAWEKNEQIQLQHEGTGTPDTTKHEWRVNQYRDSLATIALLPGLLTYQSMGLGEPEAIVRTRLLDKMVQPCGPAPPLPVEAMTEIVKQKLRDGSIQPPA